MSAQTTNSHKPNRYTSDQIKEILKIRIELAKGLISCEVAQRETLKIAPTYPTHNLNADAKRMQKTLVGIGEYYLSCPANWAQARKFLFARCLARTFYSLPIFSAIFAANLLIYPCVRALRILR